MLVDGKKVGVTPYMLEKITFGQHRVELQKAGYEKYVKVVVIKADELENTQLENVTLKKDANYKEQQVAVTPTTPQTQSTQKVQSTPREQNKNTSLKQCFSVSPTKRVEFSKGNLQYQASTKTWRFAEHQWDMIGADNKKISKRYNGWIDLFGWGTGNNPTNRSTNYSDYGSFSDWGNNSISNGGGKKWFTLTKDEWVYVFDKRGTSSGIRYVKATVNGVNGVILLPDNWSSGNYNLSDINESKASFRSNLISWSDWTSKLEANGAVFLPAAGGRIRTEVYSVGFAGDYWSASYSDYNHAYGVGFSDDSLYDIFDGRLHADYEHCRREGGRSVRLVSLSEN